MKFESAFKAIRFLKLLNQNTHKRYEYFDHSKKNNYFLTSCPQTKDSLFAE
jgi:hypothetical protein